MTRLHGGTGTASSVHARIHHRHVVLLDVVEGSWVDGVSAACLIVDVIENLSRELDIVVREFANLGVIDAQDLSILSGAETKTRDQVHDEEDQAGSAEGVETTTERIRKLVGHLDPVLVQPTTVDTGDAVKSCNAIVGEEGGADVADKAADTVYSKDVKRVVDAEDELELGGVVGE